MIESLRILHISDLHFGTEGQDDVWTSLRSYVNNTLKPDLILVTGDIIDSPDERWYREAKEELDRLQSSFPRYFVCPGNHDRHLKGNALGRFLGKFFKRFSPSTKASSWFDNQFQGRVPPSDRPEAITLGQPHNRWRIHLYGLDTSAHAKYSAQGVVPLDSLERLKNIAGASTTESNDDADLVIVLLHHHLLPIAELERSRQTIAGLAGATTLMLNAGSLLEALARQSVNLVLHGHEHCKAAARYGSLRVNQGTVTVIGAGSATGMETGSGCDRSRASMNLIELRPDRTVWLGEISHPGDGWQVSNDALQVFDARAIRQARATRRIQVESPSTSQITKIVEFTPTRNIMVREIRTNWACTEPEWPVVTVNSSGSPVAPRVVFTWEGGSVSEVESPGEFLPLDGRDYAYIFRGRVPGPVPGLARRVNVEYLWLGGGVLTTRDLKQLDKTKCGPYRRNGQEFIALTVDNALEALTLIGIVPPRFAPDSKTVEVFVEPPASPGGQSPARVNRELAALVQHTGDGRFSLVVPYPVKGFRYVLAWRLQEPPEVSEMTRRWRAVARTNGERLVAALDTWPGKGTLGDFYSASLYIPQSEDTQDPSPLQRVGLVVKGSGVPTPPDTLFLKDGCDYATRGWWGEVTQAASENSEELTDHEGAAGFLRGERILVVLPLRHPGSEAGEDPWGILRVAVRSNESQEGLEAKVRAVSQALASATIFVLQKGILQL